MRVLLLLVLAVCEGVAAITSYHVALGAPTNSGIWQTDTSFCKGGVSWKMSNPGYTPPFQYLRYGTTFTCSFQVVPGTYTVTLRFVEPTVTKPGLRTFNAEVNGFQFLNGFDIVKFAGTVNLQNPTGLTPIYETSYSNVVTQDGNIVVKMTGVIGNAVLSGLVIEPGPVVTRDLSMWVGPVTDGPAGSAVIPGSVHQLNGFRCQSISYVLMQIVNGEAIQVEPDTMKVNLTNCDVTIGFTEPLSNFYVTLYGLPITKLN